MKTKSICFLWLPLATARNTSSNQVLGTLTEPTTLACHNSTIKTPILPPLLALLTLCLGTLTALGQSDVLVATNSNWKYLDDGSDQGTGWRANGFNDANWPSGLAPHGYGMTSITTTNASGRITYYYRQKFTVGSPALYSNVVVRLRRDDGGIVYINNVEVFRSNMPTGAVDFATLASSSISGAAQFQYFSTNANPSVLVLGTNQLAVEIHQASAGNVDSAFDLELVGQRSPCTPAAITSGPSNLTVCVGDAVSFSATASGTPPLFYQWQKNTVNIPGATGTTYSFGNAQPTDAGTYSVIVTNACGSASSNATLVVNQCGPVITGVSPTSGQMGDLLTISGSGFDSDRPNNCVILRNGSRSIPLRVVQASSNQLVVLVGPVPPDATPGQIGVSVGQGAENGFIDTIGCPTCPKKIRIPWLGEQGEPGPQPPFNSLQLRAEDTTGPIIIGGGTNDGVALPSSGLGWIPLPPVWTFSSSGAGTLSGVQVTLQPTPQPPATSRSSWVFSTPAANGTVSIVISNDCPPLTQVQIQGDIAISGLGMDFIFPRLILTARLPVLPCAQVICDLLVAAYAQRGITINCTVTPVGANAARLTISVPGQTIGSGGITICFSRAEAGQATPFITGFDPASATEGDIITITGGGFGNNPDDMCWQLINPGRNIGLRVLTAQDDRVTAIFPVIPSNAVAGPLGVARGIGRGQSITDRSNTIVNPSPAWVFASSQTGVASLATLLPIPPPPPPPPPPGQPIKKRFVSQPVDANGTMCITVDPNCPKGTTISIEAHFNLCDTDPLLPPDCPLTYIDTLLFPASSFVDVFGGSGTGGDCVDFVCQYLAQILYNDYNALFGACFGYPISCAANLTTGEICITGNADCGCRICGGEVYVTYCIPNGPLPPPIISEVSPNAFHSGELITITGTNFDSNPDNVCVVLVNPNRLIPLRAVSVVNTQIIAQVGPIPPDAQPGRIGLALGSGNTGIFQPAFGDIEVKPAWFFTATNAGVLSPTTVTPIYVPPPPQETWYHSFLSNGQVYVFLPGPCPPGTKLIMDGHFNIQPANGHTTHVDCWLPAVTYYQGGSAQDCARRVCDSFVCGFLQRTGVKLNCTVIPQGNGALICVSYPKGTIVNGGMTVCVRICDQPPLANCFSNTSYTFSHGTVGDNFAGPESAFPRPELVAWLSSVGINSTRGYDDNFVVNRAFADSFTNLPPCITKATLRIRLRANPDIEENDGIMLAFAGAGGVLDPVRWSSYIGAGNAGPGVTNTIWTSPKVVELVLDLSRLPLGNNQFRDLIPTLCAKQYLDLYVQDDTSVDYAILELESCRCRPDIIACAKPGANCAVVTFAQPTFTDQCCPGQPAMLNINCVPPSGTCLPIGTNTVRCTATDAMGRKARCCFLVIVQPATPPSLCPNPVEVVYSIGTTNDNFVGAEPAFPSPGLLARLMAAGITRFKGFDDCTVNSYFAHTFTNLPSCIVEAHLSVRFKACGDISQNDSFGLGFTQPSGANVPGWSRYLGNQSGGANGLFNTTWNPNTVGAITLDLSALPNASGAPTDLIPKLNLYGFLDLFMQDDSAIDYAVLSVKSCCCRSDIVLITPTNQCCAVATYTLPSFSTNCGTVNVQCTPPSGTCFPVGTNLVECRATDSFGQTGRCFFKVIVKDAIPPTIISCPTNIIACQGNTNLGVMPNLISQVVATDNCTPATLLTITQNPLPGTPVNGGTVTFTVTDGAGNVTTCTRPIVIAPCCLPPPPGLVLWLPFDELAGPTAFNAAGGNNGTLMNGTTRLAGEYVNRSLCYDGVDDFVGVPNYPAINPGTRDFTLDAWVKRDPNSGNSVRIIVDKRALAGFNTGYSLSVSFGNLIMTLADATGTSNYRDTGTVPADNQWHFVAVSITRALTTGGRFYIDGTPTGTFDPTDRPGSLDNTMPFRVGSSPVGGNIPWLGCIDEVEMFRRALKPQEISALYNSRVKGKCRPSCTLPWDTMICPGQPSVVVIAKICNTAPVAQTYNYFFHGLPPGPMCTFPGPTSFSPASGSVTVGPNSCMSFPVTIGVPAGMPCGNIACYEMVFVLAGTTEQYACEGSLYKPCIPFCARPVTNITTAVFNRTNLLSFTLTSSSSSPINLTGARFTAFGPDMLPDAQFVSLNGLPPGVPFEVPPGLILPPNGQITLSVNATFVEYSPGQAFTILLEADTDGDGEFEPLASMELVNVIVGTECILTISRAANGDVVLEWSDCPDWVLQQSANVAGPYLDVPGAVSGYTVTPGGAGRFYRLRSGP